MLEKLFSTVSVLILVYMAWAWGGLHQDWLVPAASGSGVLLIGLLITQIRGGIEVKHNGYYWWQDGFFYAGLFFLIYLSVQWWNSGRVLFFDVGLDQWRYSQPRHPGWPSAFSRPEAAQMLSWFFPAWVFGLLLRSPLLGTRTVLRMLRSLVYGAGLLALLGIIQFVTGTKARYWVRPATDQFFASFGYTNHAAAFFVLMGAVAAGLLYREVFRERPVEHNTATSSGGSDSTSGQAKGRSLKASSRSSPTARQLIVRTTALAASLLFCLIGANLSLSRAGIILAWSMALFIAGYGLVRGWQRLHRVARVNLVAATFAILCVLYFAVSGFGEKAIVQEFKVRRPIHHVLFPVLDNINLALSDRPLLDRVAWEIWCDNPVFGVGGWGFRYLLSQHLPEAEWKSHVEGFGNANVHCDPLQFLAEFGVVGTGLMMAALLALLLPVLRKGIRKEARSISAQDPEWEVKGRGQIAADWSNPVLVMCSIGLMLVCVFSLIDLPFRCPAILCTWVVILAALPRFGAPTDSRQRSGAPILGYDKLTQT